MGDQKYLYTELQNSPILNFFSSFSQGDFFVLGPFTLGILPNINASICLWSFNCIFFKAFCIWVEFCSSIRNCEYSNHWFNYHFVVKRVNYRKRGREWNLFVYFC